MMSATEESSLSEWGNESDEILRRDALILHHATDGLGEHTANAEFLHLGAGATVGDTVGEDHFLQSGVGHALVGRS